MLSVPFSLPDTYGGLAEAHGIIRLEGTYLTLEFEVRDGVFGIVKSGVKVVALQAAEIAAISFKRSAFRATITLRCHSVRSVEGIPSQKAGEFRISIKRAYRDEAEQLASALRLAISEARLNAIQNEK